MRPTHIVISIIKYIAVHQRKKEENYKTTFNGWD